MEGAQNRRAHFRHCPDLVSSQQIPRPDSADTHAVQSQLRPNPSMISKRSDIAVLHAWSAVPSRLVPYPSAKQMARCGAGTGVLWAPGRTRVRGRGIQGACMGRARYPTGSCHDKHCPKRELPLPRPWEWDTAVKQRLVPPITVLVLKVQCLLRRAKTSSFEDRKPHPLNNSEGQKLS
jgi:hypothetical protein